MARLRTRLVALPSFVLSTSGLAGGCISEGTLEGRSASDKGEEAPGGESNADGSNGDGDNSPGGHHGSGGNVGDGDGDGDSSEGGAGCSEQRPFSDSFNGDTLGSCWTFVDPMMDCELTMTGTAAQISIPEGIEHQLWSNAGSSPRLLQDVPDEDFHVEVVFDSLPSKDLQGQGLLFVQDEFTFLRIDQEFVDDGTKFMLAFIDGAAVPLFEGQSANFNGGSPRIRVLRQGDEWSFEYSTDGELYSPPLVRTAEFEVNQMGIYGVNRKAKPATTITVEEFKVLPLP